MTTPDFNKSGTEPRDAVTGTVSVAAFGSDPMTVDFIEGQTVGDYLKRADVKVGWSKAVNLNGTAARKDTPVTKPGARIVVANKVRNG